MYLPPYAAEKLARQRQREKLAQAGRQRPAHQLAVLAIASRRAQRAERPMRRAVQPRAELPR